MQAGNQETAPPQKGLAYYLIVLAGLSLVAGSLLQLYSFRSALEVARINLGNIPVQVFRTPVISRGPAIVVAHGFAGSQQLMYPLALNLARNGYVAVTFDFAGHGRNATPMEGGIKDMAKSTEHLLSELGSVVRFARNAEGSDGRVALLGHSMAAELVVQYAMREPDVEAVAALSLFGKAVTAEQPRNLLVVTGDWEPGILKDAGFRILSLTQSEAPKERVTYGNLDSGSARRFVLARGAEHIGVIYSVDAQRETLDWMNAVFKRKGSEVVQRQGLWIACLLLGLVLLARPALSFLPRVSNAISLPERNWPKFMLVAIFPAVATPLLLWKTPTDFLPILLGDYLAVHFTVYGLLTWLALAFFRRGNLSRSRVASGRVMAVLVAAAAVAAYQILFMGVLIDQHVASFLPVGLRWVLVPVMFIATATYFSADAALLTEYGLPRAGYAITKLCFALSLAVAVVLNPPKLFFLAIIVPVICIFFIVYGLVTRWTRFATGEIYAPALGNALALAWSIAITFPIVQ